MSGFALFGALLLLLATAVVWAALRSSGRSVPTDRGAARRDAAIEALRELEFERETGKLPEEEYRRLRGRLEREAVRARDAALEAGPRPGSTAAGEPDAPPSDASRSDAPPSDVPAAAEPASGGAEAACPSCQRPLEGGEKFCPSCGTSLIATG